MEALVLVLSRRSPGRIITLVAVPWVVAPGIVRLASRLLPFHVPQLVGVLGLNRRERHSVSSTELGSYSSLLSGRT